MSEYAWPGKDYENRAATARGAWTETIRTLPLGTKITGEVVGRQRFGVFLSIDGWPDAVGLAEIIAMPRCLDLPVMGERVSGEVVSHAEHNHQVKIRLAEWAEHEDAPR
ncbi:hypothetical protein [Streptomyces sp. AK02-01A]|uniref:hypothetical protein n=1 Tax=Streptomyces sp. AK02-01A TaxID=3028648 RepID=UPI0029B496F6|nr:hypothetical protein [Streptomyces sp. AK02-01A]MDX3854166.1 hypothetical protein [Streptomyces sp. AK02-01A]